MAGIRKKQGCLCGALLLVVTVAVMICPASGSECTTATYDSAEFTEPRTRFFPYEKVFVKIRCSDLEAGEYVVHANWIHHKRGIVRSDKHAFKMDIKDVRVIFFWFKLNRKGPFSSVLTNKDFHEENFGEWVVETYLNNKRVGTSAFEISPEQ